MHTDLKHAYDNITEAKSAANAIKKRTGTPMTIYTHEGRYYLARRKSGKKHGRYIKDKVAQFGLNQIRKKYDSIYHERKIITGGYGIPRSTEKIGMGKPLAPYKS